MLALFMSIAGGVSWVEVVGELQAVRCCCLLGIGRLQDCPWIFQETPIRKHEIETRRREVSSEVLASGLGVGVYALD